MSLSEIIFEYIDAEKRYARGKYSEFKVVLNKQGYINATKLCKDGNKNFFHWVENKSSKELLEELSSHIGKPMCEIFMKVSGGKNMEIRGTYVHPLLVPHIASWISPSFALKVSHIINEFVVQEYKNEIAQKDKHIKEKDSKIDELTKKVDALLSMGHQQLNEVKCTRKELLSTKKVAVKTQKKLDIASTKLTTTSMQLENVSTKLATTTNQLENISTKLDIATEDRVPKALNEEKKEVFVILENKTVDKFYCIRRQVETIDRAIKDYKKKGDDITEFLRIDNPNSVNLLVRIKEKLFKKINYSGNTITLKKISREDFKKKVLKINEEKKYVDEEYSLDY